MRFWDTSAIVPLLVDEDATSRAEEAHADDPEVIVWWATAVECTSALARLERDGALVRSEVTQARRRLDALAAGWHEVQPTDPVRRTAIRLLQVHPLRAADALQIAAAWAVSEGRPDTLAIVTFDVRLRDAGDREGFAIVPGGLT